jgi:hypothetical protein
MHKLNNWTAKRSGPCMTVKGSDAGDGSEVKLSGIYAITGRRGRVFAENGVGNVLAELSPN